MRIIYFILVAFSLASCGSTKEIETPVEVKPDWVKQKPIENIYYSGIGMAYKNSPDYMAIAKSNALNDLASEISVKINSTSVLYQVEQNEKFREEFKANTRLHSIEDIEGFELTAAYENTNEYWVYYRLSKAEYDARKAARKKSAVSKAIDLFNKAQDQKEQSEYDDAIVFSIKALESISSYLGDGLQTEINGSNVYLGNELYKFITNTINQISIEPIVEEFEIIRGKTVDAELLSFRISNDRGENLSGIPVYFYYSGRRIKNNELLSNNSGIISYPLGKITSKNASEYLQANLNLVSVAKESTSDPIVSQLISKISGPESRIQLNIKKPIIFIKSEETNLDKEEKSTTLASAFKKELLKNDFIVSDDAEKANYLLNITANTKPISNNSGFFSATLDADIKLYDKELNLLYTHQINQLKGVQLDFEKAGIDAYQKASEQIQKRIFRDMRRMVFD